jgi:transposase-like protein
MAKEEVINALEQEIAELEKQAQILREMIRQVKEMGNNSGIVPINYDSKIVKLTRKGIPTKFKEKPKKHTTQMVDPETREKAMKLLEEGKLTLEQIAKKVGCNKASFYNWFDMKNYKKNKKKEEKAPSEKKPDLSDPCPYCQEQEATAWFDGKPICPKCFDIQIKIRKSKHKEKKDDDEINPEEDLAEEE